MSVLLPSVDRRLFLSSTIMGAIGTLLNATAARAAAAAQPSGDSSIRPFKFQASDEDLADLKRRVAAAKWPERETVSDATQGVNLATMQKLAHYWQTEHDWRMAEAKLNSYPQFITNIDGLDIHYIHVRSKNANALPVIITHGWPGSIIEQLKVIDPLTDPTASGGNAADSFDVVIPSLPGYGFSGKPTTIGWDPQHIASAWAVLMNRLGYTRYIAQGGDWGNAVTEQMALQQPPGLIAVHTNMPATVPDDVAKTLPGGPPPPGLSADEKYAWDQPTSSTGMASATPRRWRTVLRRFTASPIHRSGWPPG